MEQSQNKDNQELAALNVLVKAAEQYLMSIDELARGPTTAHIQNAITILARMATAPKTAPGEVFDEAADTSVVAKKK